MPPGPGRESRNVPPRKTQVTHNKCDRATPVPAQPTPGGLCGRRGASPQTIHCTGFVFFSGCVYV